LNVLEIAGTLTGIAAVWLTTRQNVWCWPIGVVNVSLYAVVFHGARLYADMGLQLVYVVLCLYGWYHWLHPGPAWTVLPVTRIDPRTAVIVVAVSVAAAGGLGTVLARRTDALLPYLEAATAVASLAAQWLQTRKVLENWHVWLATNVVYVGMYLSRGLYFTTGLYAVFAALAVLGLLEWRRSMAAAR
jgi:nicotinamide mononucleotide transporter